MLHPGSRHQGDVAEGRAAEVGQDRLVGVARQPVRLAREMLQGVVAHRAELFQVVLHVQLLVVDRLLTHDRVEVVAPLGHAPAGRHRAVALGIHEDVAVGLGRGVEGPGHEHRRAVEERPGLPVLVFEAEHRLLAAQSQHVHAQGLDQVRGDLAQHLVGLDHLDRRARPVQTQGLAQLVHRADVHSGDRAGAEVEWHVIGLLVVQCLEDALARVHGSSTQ